MTRHEFSFDSLAAAAAGSKALRLTVCLAVISEVAGWHPRTPLTPRTAQWTTRMQSIFAEKGQHSVYEINPALDEINVSTCHFPKHGPPREKVFSPKWEQDRYRNYKHRPNTPMRHVLKPPTAPRGLIISWTLPEGMDFAYNATVFWQAPASTGQSNITHYVISRDNGLSWTEVKGGGAINQTVLTGLRRQAHVHVHLRAVNAVGTGPPAYVSRSTPFSPYSSCVRLLIITHPNCAPTCRHRP